MRPRRGSRSESNLEEILEELADLGAEKAWTTEKYPFMAFLMIGILPMLLLGDPVLVLLNLVGLP